MSARVLPQGGLVLRNAPAKTIRDGKQSVSSQAIAVCKLNDEMVNDLQQLARQSKKFTLLTGRTLKLKYGSKSFELAVSPERFQHEIYQSSHSAKDLQFRGIVSQTALIKTSEISSDDAAGTDAALANLKQSLASFAQEKEAKKATISTGIVGVKNKSLKPSHRNDTLSSSRALNSGSSLNPSQIPLSSDPHDLARDKAMDRVILHFLATKPRTEQQILAHTHIPTAKCRERLAKVADEDSTTHEWSLRPKAYKELDIFSFKYRSESERADAKENAIRAYDKLRLSKEDKLWDMLLPPQDRGKGIVVSKLQKALAASQAIKDKAAASGTSHSPAHLSDGQSDSKNADKKGTPKVGAGSTPRTGGLSIEKRMKEVRKQKVAEEVKEAKEKKRLEKEVGAASDRESRPKPRPAAQGKKPLPSKIKSAEVVHDSDSDEPTTRQHKDSVISNSGLGPKSASDNRAAAAKIPGRSSLPSTATKTSVTAKRVLDKNDLKTGADRKDGRLTPRLDAGSSVASRKVTPNTTPAGRSEKHVPGSANPSRNASQLSPSKSNKPKVPSPLGAARPRNTSIVSEASMNGSTRDTRTKIQTTNKAVDGAPSVRQDGSHQAAAGSSKKRPYAESSDDSDRPLKAARIEGPSRNGKPTGKVAAPRAENPPRPTHNSDSALKRKANDISSGLHDHSLGQESKHRRTESSSTHSAKYSSNSSSSGSVTNTNGTSVSSPGWQRSPSNTSSSSEATRLSWEKAICLAEKFRSHYYPKYNKLYDEISSIPPDQVKAEDRKKLWDMHRRLEQMKREIRIASE